MGGIGNGKGTSRNDDLFAQGKVGHLVEQLFLHPPPLTLSPHATGCTG